MLRRDIEKRAEEVLVRMGGVALPIPVEEIATSWNIRISYAPTEDNFSGVLIRKDASALMGVNSDEAPVRQRFTVAHELGHFLLHENKDTFVDYRRPPGEGSVRTPKEREADMFAAALLMPEKILARDYKALGKQVIGKEEIFFLAKRYGVSKEAMEFRIINLNLRSG